MSASACRPSPPAGLSWLTERPIAHRGLHDLNHTCWENTLSAFKAAARRGFALECDLHLAADGVPVVFHDQALERLTGQPGFVHERTSAEMTALTVGGTADRVPTLAQLLDAVDGRVPLVIELKGVAGKDEGFVAAVAALLSRYCGKAAIMSFDHWLIRDFSRFAPDIPGGLIGYGTTDAELEAHFSMLAHGISFVSYGVLDLPNRFVGFVRERLAMPVITWTVRDRAMMEKTRRYADQMTFEGFDPDAIS